MTLVPDIQHMIDRWILPLSAQQFDVSDPAPSDTASKTWKRTVVSALRMRCLRWVLPEIRAGPV